MTPPHMRAAAIVLIPQDQQPAVERGNQQIDQHRIKRGDNHAPAVIALLG